MDPSGRVVNTPAFLTMRVPRFPLTAPVMVESDVKVNTEVAGVSAVGVTALALPAERTRNVPAIGAGGAQSHRRPAFGAGDGVFGVQAADLEVPGSAAD